MFFALELCWSVTAARLRGARHEAPQRRSKMAPATNLALSTGQEGSFLRDLHLPSRPSHQNMSDVLKKNGHIGKLGLILFFIIIFWTNLAMLELTVGSLVSPSLRYPQSLQDASSNSATILWTRTEVTVKK